MMEATKSERQPLPVLCFSPSTQEIAAPFAGTRRVAWRTDSDRAAFS